jgi:hypothetical protein
MKVYYIFQHKNHNNMKELKNELLNVVIARNGSGSKVGMVGPDQDIDDFPTPITPYINVGRLVKYFDRVKFDKIALPEFMQVNQQIGAKFTAAYCLQDRPTCGSNPGISPVASLGEVYDFKDILQVKRELEVAINHIDRYATKVFKETRKNGPQVIETLKEGIKSLS